MKRSIKIVIIFGVTALMMLAVGTFFIIKGNETNKKAKENTVTNVAINTITNTSKNNTISNVINNEKTNTELDNTNININDETKYVAKIHYSEGTDIDNGTEYSIFIYKNTDNSYAYIKKKYRVTIAGLDEGSEIGKGTIKSKDDVKNLTKKGILDFSTYSNYSYEYVNNGSEVYLKTIEELADILFK